MKVAVKTLENKKAGDVTLSDDVFGIEPRVDLMHRTVNWQRNGRRQGSHKTKGISEISGGGRKPWAQKGTGNARQGSIRATQWRGGQTVHGPIVRDHGTKLPKKVRKNALRSALSVKAAEDKLIILDAVKAKSHKTKEMVAALDKIGIQSALIVFSGELDQNFERAVRNIPNITLLPQAGINVYDILKHDQLILTKDAAKEIEERIA